MMRVRNLLGAFAVFVVSLSLSEATLRGEEDSEAPQEAEPEQVHTGWQPLMVQPQRNVTWHADLVQPLRTDLTWHATMRQPLLGTNITWQPLQAGLAPPNSVWSVTTFAFSNPLGVEVAAADAALRSQLALEVTNGVVVTTVQPDSEAEKSGLKPHDLVLQIGETAVENPEAFNEALQQHQGQDAVFQIVRQGKRITLPVAVPKPLVYDLADISRLYVQNSADEAPRYRIGIVLAEADDTLRSQLRIGDSEGLVVTQVLEDTPAAQVGLREHDVLIELDSKRLTTVEEFNAQVQEIKDREVQVTFLRAGRESQLSFAPQLDKDATVLSRGLYSLYIQPQTVQWHANVLQNTVAYSPQVSAEQLDTSKMSVADQVAALKQQLAQLQDSLQRLEAALQATEEEPSNEEPHERE